MKRHEIRALGGPGSGNWGHAGRPGARGGSLPKTTAMSLKTGKDAEARRQAAKEDKWVKSKYGGLERREGGKRAMVSQGKDGTWRATVTSQGNKLLDKKGLTEAEAKKLAGNILSPKQDVGSLSFVFGVAIVLEGVGILKTRARPEVWASQFLPKGTSDKLVQQVAKKLVADGVLKPDKRRRPGYKGGETEQYRISKGWLNQQGKEA